MADSLVSNILDLNIAPAIKCPNCGSMEFYLNVDHMGSNASKITGFECTQCGLNRYFNLPLGELNDTSNVQ